MLSIRYSSRIKSRRNKKIPTKKQQGNWEGINYPSEKYDWKKKEKKSNNRS